MGRITKRPAYTRVAAGGVRQYELNKIIDFHSTDSGHIQHRRMHFHLKWHYPSATAAAAGNSSASTHSRIRRAFGILCPARAKYVSVARRRQTNESISKRCGPASQSDSNSQFTIQSDLYRVLNAFLLVQEDNLLLPCFRVRLDCVFERGSINSANCSTHLAAAAAFASRQRSQSGEPSKIGHR